MTENALVFLPTLSVGFFGFRLLNPKLFDSFDDFIRVPCNVNVREDVSAGPPAFNFSSVTTRH